MLIPFSALHPSKAPRLIFVRLIPSSNSTVSSPVQLLNTLSPSVVTDEGIVTFFSSVCAENLTVPLDSTAVTGYSAPSLPVTVAGICTSNASVGFAARPVIVALPAVTVNVNSLLLLITACGVSAEISGITASASSNSIVSSAGTVSSTDVSSNAESLSAASDSTVSSAGVNSKSEFSSSTGSSSAPEGSSSVSDTLVCSSSTVSVISFSSDPSSASTFKEPMSAAERHIMKLSISDNKDLNFSFIESPFI